MRFLTISTGSKGNAYLLGVGSEEILLDCGVSSRKIMQAAGFRLPSAFFVSHSHKDHSLSEDFFEKSGVKRIGYVPEAFAGCAFWPFPLVHDVPNFGLLFGGSGEKALYVTDTAFVHNRFRGVQHFLIECNYVEDILAARVASGRLVPSLADRIRRGHFELQAVKDFLKVNVCEKTRNIVLLHLSDGNSDSERMRSEIQSLFPMVNVFVAEDGSEFEL